MTLHLLFIHYYSHDAQNLWHASDKNVHLESKELWVSWEFYIKHCPWGSAGGEKLNGWRRFLCLSLHFSRWLCSSVILSAESWKMEARTWTWTWGTVTSCLLSGIYNQQMKSAQCCWSSSVLVGCSCRLKKKKDWRTSSWTIRGEINTIHYVKD